jgi:hypothetical protein
VAEFGGSGGGEVSQWGGGFGSGGGFKKGGIEVATARVEGDAARRLVCVTLFAFYSGTTIGS